MIKLRGTYSRLCVCNSCRSRGLSVAVGAGHEVDGSGSQVTDGQEVSTAVVEENWDDDILDMTADMSPFGNCC